MSQPVALHSGAVYRAGLAGVPTPPSDTRPSLLKDVRIPASPRRFCPVPESAWPPFIRMLLPRSRLGRRGPRASSLVGGTRGPASPRRRQGAAEAPRERRLAGQGGGAGAGAAQPPTCGPGEPSAPAAAPCRQSLRETVRCPGCPSARTAATAPSLTPTRSSAGGYAGAVVPRWAASARGHVRGSAFLRLRPRHPCESLRDRRPALGDTGSEAGGCKGCRRATQGCH